MIVSKGKIIESIVSSRKVIGEVRTGLKVVWQYVRSCFGSGAWVNDKGWRNDEGWKN